MMKIQDLSEQLKHTKSGIPVPDDALTIHWNTRTDGKRTNMRTGFIYGVNVDEQSNRISEKESERISLRFEPGEEWVLNSANGLPMASGKGLGSARNIVPFPA